MLSCSKVSDTGICPKCKSKAIIKNGFAYNIRGWLKSINNTANLSNASDPRDLFSFLISYNVIPDGVYNSTPLFNGNISETSWRTSNDNVHRKYSYQYDGLNRLTTASYRKPELTNPDTNSYNESLIYDKNGNITALQRTGGYDDSVSNLTIDNLLYYYNPANPNQLDKVYDSTTNPNGFKDGTNSGNDYNYDANGNMETDQNKGIVRINYNHLNLPTTIEFDVASRNISYLYNANGEKVKKTVSNGTPLYQVVTTDYLDGFQYASNLLEFFPHAEGYVKNTVVSGVNNYNYVFNYTDHLGNVRLSYGLDATYVLKILEENNYYPFGLSHKNYNMDQKTYNKTGAGTVTICSSCPTGYKYKYNGKELQDELGLNIYDYGSRLYDPARAGWSNVDPLAEQMRRWSPYNYCFNNPMRFTDPDGMKPTDWVLGGDGKWIWRSDIKSASQATSAGYKGYSDGKSNNVHATTNGSTLTLKENAKWVDSSNGIQKTASDNALISNVSNAIEVVGGVNDVVDNVASSLNSNAGITRLGSNGTFYFETPNGNVFNGNQHVTTTSIGKLGAGISKYAGPIGYGVNATQVGIGVYNDGGEFGYNAQVATGGAIGGMVAAEAGATIGAEIGAAIGVWFGGAGAIPGAIIGAAIGGIGFGLLGSEAGANVVKESYQKK